MKILLGTGTTYRTHTLKETEDMALSLGYDGIEIMIPPRHHSPGERERDTAYETVKYALAVHAPGDVFDAQRFAASLEDGLRVVQEVQAEILNVHPASATFGGRENVVQAIELVKRRQAEAGVTISYEVLVDPRGLDAARQERFRQMQAYQSMDEWVEDVKQYNLSATLDTCHVGTWKQEPAKYIEQLGKNLVHVHFSDYDSKTGTEHLLPGTGDVDLVGFLHELQKHRPDVMLALELIPGATVEQSQDIARRSIEFLRKTLQ